MESPETLVLASASPRRRALLAGAGIGFEVLPSNADESLEPGLEPEHAARLLAVRKARAVHALRAGRPELILAADTVVAVGEGAELELLGKPVDEADARRMLCRLSETRHRVVTGICVLDARLPLTTPGEEPLVDHERTWVHMRRILEEEVEAYVASGEWQDKAGGYAIQETADRFVTRLEGGGFDNVVGLPVELTLALLRRGGLEAPTQEP